MDKNTQLETLRREKKIIHFDFGLTLLLLATAKRCFTNAFVGTFWQWFLSLSQCDASEPHIS